MKKLSELKGYKEVVEVLNKPVPVWTLILPTALTILLLHRRKKE